MQLPLAAIFLPPATKLGQRNIFSSVCQIILSTGGSKWAGTPRAGAPSGQVTPPGRYTPGRYRPRAGKSLGSYTSQGRYNPWAGTTPGQVHPPAGTSPAGTLPLLDTTGYGQWTSGTHPTGMHSCSRNKSIIFCLNFEHMFILYAINIFGLSVNYQRTTFFKNWSSFFFVQLRFPKTQHSIYSNS